MFVGFWFGLGFGGSAILLHTVGDGPVGFAQLRVGPMHRHLLVARRSLVKACLPTSHLLELACFLLTILQLPT